MKKSKTPDAPPPAPPPVSSTGQDQAQVDADAKRREKGRYDFSRTILRPGGPYAPLPDGTKTTLG